MNIRVRASKLCLLLLHVTALNLHPCSSLQYSEVETITPPGGDQYSQRPNDNYGVPDSAVIVKSWSKLSEESWMEYYNRKYFYAHNETQIAMARAVAEADRHDRSAVLSSATFPDFQPSEDGCNWNSVADLSYDGVPAWDGQSSDDATFQILVVDSCTKERNAFFGSQIFELSSQRWENKKPDFLIRDDRNPPTENSFKVIVKIVSGGLPANVLAEGVYFPATGKMHLVGCTRGQLLSSPPTTQDFVMNVSYEEQNLEAISPEQGKYYVQYDPDSYHDPPLNSSTPIDCAISAMVQYPPLNCRWNSDRVLKYSIRSKRAESDALYFPPIERSVFFPYLDRYFRTGDPIQQQRRIEIGVRILLLVVGLVCIALQIEHGRKNEESLPFVSLVMLGIQLGSHLSQTSIVKDLQIGEYGGGYSNFTVRGYSGLNLFPDLSEEYNYYGTMAWSEHVPYQAMAMAAIFMYVWVFHKVGDRRRIMKLRVLRQRAGAKDPPSDWRVMYATLAIFAFVGILGFFVIGADQEGHLRRALSGMTAAYDRYSENFYRDLSPYNEDYSPFVSSRFYELAQAQWGFVNRLTGLVVSFFLVPQLLGNMEWEVQGRPLSVWFYAGIPFLQSLPHIFSIAKYFQLLPIFPLYDPYINSMYGIFENPTPWWQVGVVLCSTLQVLAVHSQFSTSLHGSRHSSPKAPHVQACDML